ncbi:hypothetical protein BHUM_04138c [Candidatus Burkholderia humilis]|nr:hypothetical protein BHUM_04138c [Candidatus Burkholderia humilis]
MLRISTVLNTVSVDNDDPHDGDIMTALARSFQRLAPAAVLSALVCIAAYGETPCPGYVETDGGSAFDLAAIIKDTGSPQSALTKVRSAVSKIDAGGGCAAFFDTHACEETLTLTHKAIAALQACSSKSTTHGNRAHKKTRAA